MKTNTLLLVALLGMALITSCSTSNTNEITSEVGGGKIVRARLISETVETIVPIRLNSGELEVYKYGDTVQVFLGEPTGNWFILSSPADDTSAIAVLERD